MLLHKAKIFTNLSRLTAQVKVALQRADEFCAENAEFLRKLSMRYLLT